MAMPALAKHVIIITSIITKSITITTTIRKTASKASERHQNNPVLNELATVRSGLVVFSPALACRPRAGFPLFGTRGYWTIGSRHYQPQELATAATFSRMPKRSGPGISIAGPSVVKPPLMRPFGLVALEKRLGRDFCWSPRSRWII